MTELLTAAQMRSIEAAAIASGEVTGLELMERAGRGVVEAIFEEWPELRATSHRAVVLCGPGNNGSDGFVVARLLKDWGWEVEVFLYGDVERMPPDARVNYERWLGMGEVGIISDQPTQEETNAQYHLARNADVFIDAVFGIGLNRPVAAISPMVSLFLHEIDDIFWPTGEVFGPRIVSIDIPTGLCADSGLQHQWPIHVQMTEFAAHLTITFHRPKVGHFLGLGPKYSNRLRVVDLQIAPADDEDTASAFRKDSGRVFLTREPTKDWLVSSQIRKNDGEHKYTHGHALILSGPPGKGGAARVAARGALRIGAGLVTVGCPPDAMPENAARLDAIMLRSLGDADALAELLVDPRINVLCLGPGMGTGEREVGLVRAALESRGEPRTTGDVRRGSPRLVLDADALTILSQNPALFAALHANCILTPHAGEFARLFPDIAAKLATPATKGPAYSKVDATREAAKRAGCVVLFKGPDTVIADPSGRCAINSAHYDRAAPWLATAGSGDVLAGFITGLLARGFAPMQAAETAAWLHVECARSFGPGLIAEHLPEELPKVFRALGL